MIVSFLLSAFLFTGVVILIIAGVFDFGTAIFLFPQQAQVLIIPAFFLALFLIIFFSLNLRQYSAAAAEKDNDLPCLLEDISTESGGNTPLLGRLFTFPPGNPELLQVAGNEVIYEHNGIHYIKDAALNSDKNTERDINNDFAKLVESVVKV
jgi:hypothetical protein